MKLNEVLFCSIAWLSVEITKKQGYQTLALVSSLFPLPKPNTNKQSGNRQWGLIFEQFNLINLRLDRMEARLDRVDNILHLEIPPLPVPSASESSEATTTRTTSNSDLNRSASNSSEITTTTTTSDLNRSGFWSKGFSSFLSGRKDN